METSALLMWWNLMEAQLYFDIKPCDPLFNFAISSHLSTSFKAEPFLSEGQC